MENQLSRIVTAEIPLQDKEIALGVTIAAMQAFLGDEIKKASSYQQVADAIGHDGPLLAGLYAAQRPKTRHGGLEPNLLRAVDAWLLVQHDRALGDSISADVIETRTEDMIYVGEAVALAFCDMIFADRLCDHADYEEIISALEQMGLEDAGDLPALCGYAAFYGHLEGAASGPGFNYILEIGDRIDDELIARRRAADASLPGL